MHTTHLRPGPIFLSLCVVLGPALHVRGQDYMSSVLTDNTAFATAPSAGTTNGTYTGITLGQASFDPLLGSAAQWNPGNGSSFVDFGGGDGAATNLPWLTNYRPSPGENKTTTVEYWIKT